MFAAVCRGTKSELNLRQILMRSRRRDSSRGGQLSEMLNSFQNGKHIVKLRTAPGPPSEDVNQMATPGDASRTMQIRYEPGAR